MSLRLWSAYRIARGPRRETTLGYQRRREGPADVTTFRVAANWVWLSLLRQTRAHSLVRLRAAEDCSRGKRVLLPLGLGRAGGRSAPVCLRRRPCRWGSTPLCQRVGRAKTLCNRFARLPQRWVHSFREPSARLSAIVPNETRYLVQTRVSAKDRQAHSRNGLLTRERSPPIVGLPRESARTTCATVAGFPSFRVAKGIVRAAGHSRVVSLSRRLPSTVGKKRRAKADLLCAAASRAGATSSVGKAVRIREEEAAEALKRCGIAEIDKEYLGWRYTATLGMTSGKLSDDEFLLALHEDNGDVRHPRATTTADLLWSTFTVTRSALEAAFVELSSSVPFGRGSTRRPRNGNSRVQRRGAVPNG
jgi:hypothetical protein